MDEFLVDAESTFTHPYVENKVKVLVAQSCLTLCDPRDCNPPGSTSMEFSRQGFWSGLPFPSPMQESEK